MKILFAFIFILICNQKTQISGQSTTCDLTTCPHGCCTSDQRCTTDISACQLNKNYDFDYLINTLIALAAFIIGFPIVLYLLDFLFMSRVFCQMSLCELIANYLCCCLCVKSRLKPSEETKINYQKVAPSNMA